MAANDVPLQVDDATRHQNLDILSYASTTLALKAGKGFQFSATSPVGFNGASPVGKSTDALYGAIPTVSNPPTQAEVNALVNSYNKLVADLKLLGFIAAP